MQDFFAEMLDWKRRAERAERLLTDQLTPKEIGRAHHLADLEEKCARLGKLARDLQVVVEDRNRTLYATGLIVHCTGCLAGGPANYEGLTEERVVEVEEIAARLRIWWTNNRGRIKHGLALHSGEQ